jgi:hypothetical protein
MSEIRTADEVIQAFHRMAAQLPADEQRKLGAYFLFNAFGTHFPFMDASGSPGLPREGRLANGGA